MTVLSDARILLRHAKKWTIDEIKIDRMLAQIEAHKRSISSAKTVKEQIKHTKRFHKTYKELASLVADKKRIEYDIRRIQVEIMHELARRRRAV